MEAPEARPLPRRGWAIDPDTEASSNPKKVASLFLNLHLRRVHETFRILEERLCIQETRMVWENKGEGPVSFVMGPRHQKFTQVNLEAYDRDRLCEFVPSIGALSLVVEYVGLRVETELTEGIARSLGQLPGIEDATSTALKSVLASRAQILGSLRELVEMSPERAANALVNFYSVGIEVPVPGQVLRFRTEDVLRDSKALLEGLVNGFFEVLQLTEAIPPGAIGSSMLGRGTRLSRRIMGPWPGARGKSLSGFLFRLWAIRKSSPPIYGSSPPRGCTFDERPIGQGGYGPPGWRSPP